MLQDLLELLQIILLVVFLITAVHCVNYPALFRWVERCQIAGVMDFYRSVSASYWQNRSYQLAWAISTLLFSFRREPPYANVTKVTISDVLLSSSQCHDRFTFWTYTVIAIAAIFWIFRAITVFFHIVHNWDIKSFFNVALKIEDSELENNTWHEVQRRIRDAQSEMQLCIHKDHLSELDIYHRILRQLCLNSFEKYLN